MLLEFAAGAALPAGAALLLVSAGMVIVCSLPGAIVAETTGVAPTAGVGDAVPSITDSSWLPESTETFPLSAGIEIIRAESMNMTAAPIVNFARTDAVPRGAKAVLDTLLVNKAPASVFPGCSRTEPINTTQDVKNRAYRM